MRKLSNQRKSKKLVLLIFLLISLPLIVFTVFQTQELRQRADEIPTLYVLPNVDTVSKNEELVLSIILDTKQETVTSVSFSLTYPYDKLELKDIDVRTSAFATQIEYVKGSGIMKMEREATIPVIGEQQVVDIIFTALDDTTASEITIPQTARAISSTTQKNILGNTKLLSAADGEVEETQSTGINALMEWLLTSLGIN